MPEHTLLDYRPTHERGERYHQRRWLAWPAWAHRVVAPVPAQHELDLLQRAILGVLRASRLTCDELGSLLGVAPELIAHVEHGLRCSGHLDAQRSVTEQGRASLQAERDADAALVPMWVFSDPWSKQLWPFLAPTLQRAEIEPGERYPRIVINEHSSKVWFEPHPEHSPLRPEPSAILRAAEHHGQKQRWWANPGTDADELVLPNASIERLAAIDPEPVRVHLLTYLYVPEQGSDWSVCEPFGRGTSSNLRAAVRERAVQGSGLERLLIDLLQTCTEQSYEHYRATERQFEQAARGELLERLGQVIEQHGELAEQLRNAIIARSSAAQLDEAASQRRRHAALAACRTALEQLFTTLARGWPLERVDEMLPLDRDTKERLLRRLTRQCGLDGPPDSLLRVDRNKVRSVANYRNGWQLRPLLVATLLRASRDSTHPLHDAARREPALLLRIDDVAAAAGGVLHGSNSTVSSAEVALRIESTIRAVELLLGLSR